MERTLSFVFWISIFICGLSGVNGLARRRELSALAANESDSSVDDVKFIGGLFKPRPTSNPICVIGRQLDPNEDENDVAPNPAYPWALGFGWLSGAHRPTRPPWRINSSWMNATTTRSPRLPRSPPLARAPPPSPFPPTGPTQPTSPPYFCFPPPGPYTPTPTQPTSLPAPRAPQSPIAQRAPPPPTPPTQTPTPTPPSFSCYPPPSGPTFPPPGLPPPPLLLRAPGSPASPPTPIPPTPPPYICYCTPPPPPSSPLGPSSPTPPSPLPGRPSSGANCIIVNTGRSTKETKLESRIILHKRKHRSLNLRRQLQNAAKGKP